MAFTAALKEDAGNIALYTPNKILKSATKNLVSLGHLQKKFRYRFRRFLPKRNQYTKKFILWKRRMKIKGYRRWKKKYRRRVMMEPTKKEISPFSNFFSKLFGKKRSKFGKIKKTNVKKNSRRQLESYRSFILQCIKNFSNKEKKKSGLSRTLEVVYD